MNDLKESECATDETAQIDALSVEAAAEQSEVPQEMQTDEQEPAESNCPSSESAIENLDDTDSPMPEEPKVQKAGTITELEEKVDALSSKADELAVRFDAVRDGAAALQKAVTGFYTQTTDSMHRELEKYRKGLVRKLEQELFGELIDLYDAADRAVARVAEDSSNAQTLLEGIRDQIDAALFNRGVEKREAVVGEKFDGRRHHLARPDIPTGDVALDGTVAVTMKPGFDDMDESFRDLRGGCMKLRPIHVRLYKFDPALEASTPVATDEPMAVRPNPASDAEAVETTPIDAVEQDSFTSGPEVQSCFSQQP